MNTAATTVVMGDDNIDVLNMEVWNIRKELLSRGLKCVMGTKAHIQGILREHLAREKRVEIEKCEGNDALSVDIVEAVDEKVSSAHLHPVADEPNVSFISTSSASSCATTSYQRADNSSELKKCNTYILSDTEGSDSDSEDEAKPKKWVCIRYTQFSLHSCTNLSQKKNTFSRFKCFFYLTDSQLGAK